MFIGDLKRIYLRENFFLHKLFRHVDKQTLWAKTGLEQSVDFFSRQHVCPLSCKDNKDMDGGTFFIVYTHNRSVCGLYQYITGFLSTSSSQLCEDPHYQRQRVTTVCPYRYSFWEVVNDLQILN